MVFWYQHRPQLWSTSMVPAAAWVQMSPWHQMVVQAFCISCPSLLLTTFSFLHSVQTPELHALSHLSSTCSILPIFPSYLLILVVPATGTWVSFFQPHPCRCFLTIESSYDSFRQLKQIIPLAILIFSFYLSQHLTLRYRNFKSMVESREGWAITQSQGPFFNKAE